VGGKAKEAPYRVEIDDPFQGNPTPYQHAQSLGDNGAYFAKFQI
jgi:hypothetical protein